MRIPTLTTPRLVLRAFTAEDAEPLYHILREEGVLRYFPNTKPPARDRVQKMISAQLKHWGERGYGWWAVELRAQSEFLGWCGLQFLPETEEVEVSYLLGKAFWGKGLATEAARASLQHGFENFELESIVAIVHPGNIASKRVIEKLRMSFIDRSHYFGMDVYRYAIERSSLDTEGWSRFTVVDTDNIQGINCYEREIG